jgi:hypothetical protein
VAGKLLKYNAGDGHQPARNFGSGEKLAQDTGAMSDEPDRIFFGDTVLFHGRQHRLSVEPFNMHRCSSSWLGSEILQQP